jgi:hypothetical protein
MWIRRDDAQPMDERTYDLVLFGATGFTGKVRFSLVLEKSAVVGLCFMCFYSLAGDGFLRLFVWLLSLRRCTWRATMETRFAGPSPAATNVCSLLLVPLTARSSRLVVCTY